MDSYLTGSAGNVESWSQGLEARVACRVGLTAAHFLKNALGHGTLKKRRVSEFFRQYFRAEIAEVGRQAHLDQVGIPTGYQKSCVHKRVYETCVTSVFMTYRSRGVVSVVQCYRLSLMGDTRRIILVERPFGKRLYL